MTSESHPVEHLPPASRLAAFKQFVEEANMLYRRLSAAEHDEIMSEDTNARIANPEKGDDLRYLRSYSASLGHIVTLRSRHVSAKVRFQLHASKGRPIKRAAVDAVSEILLDAVGGESSLTTCPIGPVAQHYLGEVSRVTPWPPAGASLQQVNLHLGEALETLERAVSESDMIRRDRANPPPWMVERFEARQRQQTRSSGLPK